MSYPAVSFHHLADVEITDQTCQGTACFAARHRDPTRWQETERAAPRVYCLGQCFAAPASAADRDRPRIEVAAPTPVVLERLLDGGAPTLEAYTRRDGFAALERAQQLAPETIVEELERSGLRGRGGAGFPTGRKWRAVREQPRGPKHVICNADEGDPGAYVDRFILEDDPYCVLEAMAIAGLAVGATHGCVYVRREYPAAYEAVRGAVEEARAAGVLGRPGNGCPFDIDVARGHGSYVCGEETALLNALEGRRPEVRPRPPYPGEQGLFGLPTLVNNVETLASVPWIVRHGGDAYRALGAGTSRGTKVVCLSSLFRRPGLYEVEFGITVREIVEDLGGGLDTGAVKAVVIGGPLAGVLPPHLFDTAFGFDELRQVGAEVGHGGIVAFDEHTSVAELVHHVFRFGAYESCGKCTPCRVGTTWVEALFAEALSGRPGRAGREQEWQEVVSALGATSLCGHGTGLAAFAESVLAHFGEELRACFA